MAKLILTSDWHITDLAPNRRVDDYVKTQQRKIEFIIELANSKDASILHAGDVFHSKKICCETLQKYIRLFKTTNILGVFGQHDMRYHSEEQLRNTPLSVLESAEVFHTDTTEDLSADCTIGIYHCNFGQVIPVVPEAEKKYRRFNILIYHGLLCMYDEIPGTKDAVEFLKENSDFDLIVTGDSHTTFTATVGNRLIVNPGSLMRMTAAQIQHKPCVFIFDTVTKTLEQIFIPIKSYKEVFDLNDIDREEKENEKLDAFVAGLQEDTVLQSLNFHNNLDDFMKDNVVEEKVSKIVYEILDKVEE